jgi:hypothetical protein
MKNLRDQKLKEEEQQAKIDNQKKELKEKIQKEKEKEQEKARMADEKKDLFKVALIK